MSGGCRDWGHTPIWIGHGGCASTLQSAIPLLSSSGSSWIAGRLTKPAHGFVGYDIHPNHEGRGRRAIMVELDGHSGLLVRAEQLSGSEPAPSSGCVGSDA